MSGKLEKRFATAQIILFTRVAARGARSHADVVRRDAEEEMRRLPLSAQPHDDLWGIANEYALEGEVVKTALALWWTEGQNFPKQARILAAALENHLLSGQASVTHDQANGLVGRAANLRRLASVLES